MTSLFLLMRDCRGSMNFIGQWNWRQLCRYGELLPAAHWLYHSVNDLHFHEFHSDTFHFAYNINMLLQEVKKSHVAPTVRNALLSSWHVRLHTKQTSSLWKSCNKLSTVVLPELLLDGQQKAMHSTGLWRMSLSMQHDGEMYVSWN